MRHPPATPPAPSHHATDQRSGRVAIVGRPNVGKSTLLNRLVGQKLAITTPLPGATRTSLLGVYADANTQIAFVDTPGILKPRSALHRVLVDQATGAMQGVDAVCLLVVARSKGMPVADDMQIHRQILDASVPIVVAINKTDLLAKKHVLLPLLEHWMHQTRVEAVVPISAEQGDQVDKLIAELRSHLPAGLLYSDEEFLTDRPTRFFAAELLREAVLRYVYAEVPYGIAVQLDRYLEDSGRVSIDATIVVEKESHKGIVIGRGGKNLKQIGTDARLAIEAFVGRPVMLKTFVRVQERWTDHPAEAKALSQSTDR